MGLLLKTLGSRKICLIWFSKKYGICQGKVNNVGQNKEEWELQQRIVGR